jgi:hypothetical protein
MTWATPSSSLLAAMWHATACTLGCAFAIAYDVPAQVSIGRSFGMSPNATTSAALIPRSAQNSSSVDAFEQGRRRGPGHFDKVADGFARPVPVLLRFQRLVPGQKLEGRFSEDLGRRTADRSWRDWVALHEPVLKRNPGSRFNSEVRVGHRGTQPVGHLPGRTRVDRPGQVHPRPGHVPDQRAVGDDRETVTTHVGEHVRSPPQRSAGHEDHSDPSSLGGEQSSLGPVRDRAVASDQGSVEVGGHKAGRELHTSTLASAALPLSQPSG